MYVESVQKKVGKKIYTSVLIRENYRENGKVKHRTITNISDLPEPIIQNIKALIKRS